MKKMKPLKNLILEHDIQDEEFWDEFLDSLEESLEEYPENVDNLREEVLEYENDEGSTDTTIGSVRGTGEQTTE